MLSGLQEFFQYAARISPALWDGLLVTLQLFAITLIVSLPLGLIISLGGISKFRPLRGVVSIYTWVLRGTPLMLQLFFVYYALPYICPWLVLDRFPAAVVAFILNYAAYFAEIFRGGIQSIDKGQYEACKTLGFTYSQTMKRIIIPQTAKRVLPPISNETITLMKDTALAVVISVPDMLKAAKDAVNRDTDATAFFIVAIIYLALTLIMTFIFRKLEHRYSFGEQKGN